jgi:hypothetical protein
MEKTMLFRKWYVEVLQIAQGDGHEDEEMIDENEGMTRKSERAMRTITGWSAIFLDLGMVGWKAKNDLQYGADDSESDIKAWRKEIM